MLILQTVTKGHLKDHCVVKLINEVNKVAGYQIDIQNSTAFLHTNNELSENEIKKTTSTKESTTKYLGINLTEVQNLNSENYKRKELNQFLNKWKGIQCSWIGRAGVLFTQRTEWHPGPAEEAHLYD